MVSCQKSCVCQNVNAMGFSAGVNNAKRVYSCHFVNAVYLQRLVSSQINAPENSLPEP